MTDTPQHRYAAAPGTIKPLVLPAPPASDIDPETGAKKPAWPRPKLVVPKVLQPLSKKQIAALIKAARRAWDCHKSAGLTDLSFDEWRHIEVAAACGCTGLTSAQNRHFRAILSHFLLLSGDASGVPVAVNTGAATGYHGETVEERDQALWLVREHMRKFDVHENYALAIVRNQYKVNSLSALNAAQAMALLFTLQRRKK